MPDRGDPVRGALSRDEVRCGYGLDLLAKRLGYCKLGNWFLDKILGPGNVETRPSGLERYRLLQRTESPKVDVWMQDRLDR